MTMTLRVFTLDPEPVRAKRGECEALELSPSRLTCPTCANELRPVSWQQRALFWMHGFGGATVETKLWCGVCGYHRHSTTTTVTPRDRSVA